MALFKTAYRLNWQSLYSGTHGQKAVFVKGEVGYHEWSGKYENRPEKQSEWFQTRTDALSDLSNNIVHTAVCLYRE